MSLFLERTPEEKIITLELLNAAYDVGFKLRSGMKHNLYVIFEVFDAPEESLTNIYIHVTGSREASMSTCHLFDYAFRYIEMRDVSIDDLFKRLAGDTLFSQCRYWSPVDDWVYYDGAQYIRYLFEEEGEPVYSDSDDDTEYIFG